MKHTPYYIIVWFFEKKIKLQEKTTCFYIWVYTWRSPGKKFRAKNSHTHGASPFLARGRPWPSRGPLGVTFGPEIENLCENHMLWAFHISLKKKILLLIFQTLFTEYCPFLHNFNQNLFLAKSLNGLYKECAKISLKLIFGQFLLKPLSGLAKNKFWLKLSKNGQILVNKVCKMSNKIFFSMKYEMLTAYDFHIDFQFQDQKSLPRDLWMVMASPWQEMG